MGIPLNLSWLIFFCRAFVKQNPEFLTIYFYLNFFSSGAGRLFCVWVPLNSDRSSYWLLKTAVRRWKRVMRLGALPSQNRKQPRGFEQRRKAELPRQEMSLNNGKHLLLLTAERDEEDDGRRCCRRHRAAALLLHLGLRRYVSILLLPPIYYSCFSLCRRLVFNLIVIISFFHEPKGDITNFASWSV